MAKHRPVVHHLRTYGIAGLLALGSGSVFASSFALIEQSVSGMGTAYAIGSAGINDASTIFFNPAGMARLHGSHLSGGLHIVNANTDFKGNAEYREDIPFGIGGSSIDGKKKDDLDLTAVVPSGYISHQYSDKVWFGLGINVPFGLETDYSDNWVGRYHAIKSELLTININPSMAFRFNDNVSIGFGLSAMYADGELTSAADVGLGDFVSGAPQLPWFPDAVGTNEFDSKVKMTADDWGYGFNTGLLLEPTQNTRIGLHYRSEVDLTLEGHAKVSGPVANSRNKAKLDLTLPDSVSLSGYYALNTRWALMADVTWTQWSDVETLDIKVQDGEGTRSVAVWDYDDSFRYSLGTEYTPNRKWTFRTGVALDETPIPKDSLRSPRVPGNDRTWLALGLTYRYTPNLTFDFGYAHLFVDDPKLKSVSDNHNPPATSGGHRLSGEYDSSVDMLSAQVNWKFR